MPSSTPLPNLWLISDARNDAVLEESLRRLPRASGFIYRHYHLGDPQRRMRFQVLKQVARACEHIVILADSAPTATGWGADGIYGPPRALGPTRGDLLQLATAHNLREVGDANRFGCDSMLISPVFGTRSHPDAKVLGPARFRTLAQHAQAPVIALGGMTQARADALGWDRWAAIDGLSC